MGPDETPADKAPATIEQLRTALPRAGFSRRETGFILTGIASGNSLNVMLERVSLARKAGRRQLEPAEPKSRPDLEQRAAAAKQKRRAKNKNKQRR